MPTQSFNIDSIKDNLSKLPFRNRNPSDKKGFFVTWNWFALIVVLIGVVFISVIVGIVFGVRNDAQVLIGSDEEKLDACTNFVCSAEGLINGIVFSLKPSQVFPTNSASFKK
jgi:hypothetical protein